VNEQIEEEDLDCEQIDEDWECEAIGDFTTRNLIFYDKSLHDEA